LTLINEPLGQVRADDPHSASGDLFEDIEDAERRNARSKRIATSLPEPSQAGRAFQEAILTTRISEMPSTFRRVHAFVEFEVAGVDQRITRPTLPGVELPRRLAGPPSGRAL
ncbi:MAG: hypothetical protein ACXVRK_10920, partial [Gaiellaceae bacterium]